MIVHYLIDSSYIHRISEEKDAIKNTKNAIYIGNLLDCLRQNGKIILDESEILEGQLASILTEQSDNESDQQIDNEFRIALESFINNLNRSNCTYCPLPLESEQNDIKTIMPYLSAINYYPDFIFTDKDDLNDSRRQIEIGTLGQYFSSSSTEQNNCLTEQKRKNWLTKQTFDEATKQNFELYLKHFSLGSSSFIIIDKMISRNIFSNGIESNKNYTPSLAYIVTQIANKKHTEIKIISTTPYELSLIEDKEIFINAFCNKIKSLKFHKNAASVSIKFEFREETINNEKARDIFHDRFILSDSHYFAIGRGMDILNGNGFCLFNIYFCGSLSEQPKDIDLIYKTDAKTYGTPFPPVEKTTTDKNNRKVEIIFSVAQPCCETESDSQELPF